LALQVQISGKAQKYINALDRPTRKRIADKLLELAQDPFDIRTSKPVTSKDRRTARIGGYRLLFLVDGGVSLVSDVGPRGQIYR
jgi:mRNA-degrading endonuclease RelE of RelBE toxin-antitoxin system